MKLELAHKIDTHRVLCTSEKKAANVALCFSVREGNVFIYMLYCFHKMKSKLGAQGEKKTLYRGTETENVSLEALKKGRVM